MEFGTILKYICLLVAILYTFNNIGRLIRKEPVYAPQIILMGIGIVGYIMLEFEFGF